VPIGPVPAAELAQIQGGHRVQHHEHQVVFGQPLAHVHRHQQRLITLREGNSAAHTMISSTRPAPRRHAGLCDRLNRSYRSPRPSRPGPRYVLDACLDTAPFGDEAAWTYPPTSGAIDGGWLHGRGACDSKAGAAIFAHVAAHLLPVSDRLAGSLVLLFDVDEHTGHFRGAWAYFQGADVPGRVDGVMIGYPGPDYVVHLRRGVPASTCTASPATPAAAS